MALEATFRELAKCIHILDEFVNTLHVSMDYRPGDDGAAVAYDVADITLKMGGYIHEAKSAAARGRQALRHPPDMDKARRALAVCQQQFHLIEQEYTASLLSYTTLTGLSRIRDRGNTWAAWADGTKQDIEDCRELLKRVSKALAACWQEFAERLGMMSVSVQTTNIGQRIAAPSEMDLVPEPDP
jgi:hypothetical protein